MGVEPRARIERFVGGFGRERPIGTSGGDRYNWWRWFQDERIRIGGLGIESSSFSWPMETVLWMFATVECVGLYLEVGKQLGSYTVAVLNCQPCHAAFGIWLVKCKTDRRELHSKIRGSLSRLSCRSPDVAVHFERGFIYRVSIILIGTINH